MKSEWFHEIPSTLDTEWTCVLCPKGERSLIVASKVCYQILFMLILLRFIICLFFFKSSFKTSVTDEYLFGNLKGFFVTLLK